MKILAMEAARAGIIMPIEEVASFKSIYPTDLVTAIKEKYSFLEAPEFPKQWSEAQDKGLEFNVGKFRRRDGTETVINNLIILGLGIIASADSGEIAKEFLEDLFVWADKELAFRFSTTDLKFFYLSQLIVQFDKDISSIVKNFELISNSLTKAYQSFYEIPEPKTIGFTGITFDYDRTYASDELKQLSTFAIQRRIGKPYSSNSFFCQAPLPTKEHLSLLESLESQL